ncbi:MAG: hypothetical protein KIT72_00070 [Polyangiaceae bacterium]|nr:hypothetical protein [Polyangiaceae bacterium]MCW5788790.1 hypothetical protein [Polyangiaceae bacterium]
MSEAQLLGVVDDHEDGVLDAVEDALHQQRTSREQLRQALRPQLTAALVRGYEVGYRAAMATHDRSVARLQASADTDVDFLAAPPSPTSTPSGEFIAPVVDGPEVDPLAAPTQEHAYDWAALGEPASDEDSASDAASELNENDDDENENDEEGAPIIPPPAIDDEGGDNEGAGDEEEIRRTRKSSEEIEAQAEQIFEFIQKNPGTRAREARQALGLEPTEWRSAVQRLTEAGRIFYVGSTRARIYFPIPKRKDGRPKKLTATTFILALDELEPETMVEAGAEWGLTFNATYVHQIRSNARRHLARAQALQDARALMVRYPNNPEGYQALRLAHFHAKRTDAMWTACQALTTLNAADERERAFYETHRARGTRPPLGTITADLLRDRVLLTDRVLTTIVDYLIPALLERYGRPTASLGYTDAHRVDPARHSLLTEAAQLLGLQLHPVYQHAGVPRPLFFIHGDNPTIGVGAETSRVTSPSEAAFLAGWYTSYLLPGHYARPLVRSEPELRRWVHAALSLSRGEPVGGLNPLELATLEKQIDPDERADIREQAGSCTPESLDITTWLRNVDMTADRVGLLFSNDLVQAIHSIRGGFDLGDEATAFRVDGLRLWSVSEDYLELRSLLGIALT